MPPTPPGVARPGTELPTTGTPILATIGVAAAFIAAGVLLTIRTRKANREEEG